MVLAERRPAVFRDERQGGGQRGERVSEGGRVGARAGGRRGRARARLSGPDSSRTDAGCAAAASLWMLLLIALIIFVWG